MIQEQKPKFTALQNIQNLFQDKPVVAHDKHRIRMDEIAEICSRNNGHSFDEEEKQQPGQLFKQLMASINPFASYVLDECRLDGKVEKGWTLDESVF